MAFELSRRDLFPSWKKKKSEIKKSEIREKKIRKTIAAAIIYLPFGCGKYTHINEKDSEKKKKEEEVKKKKKPLGRERNNSREIHADH